MNNLFCENETKAKHKNNTKNNTTKLIEAVPCTRL